jgi:probable rRNA maturation factor
MMDETDRSGSPHQDDDDRPPTTASEPAGIAVEVADAAGLLGPADAAWIRGRTTDAIRLLNTGGEVRVRVVDDAEMADAHLRYADEPGTTDVLTFDLSEPTDDGVALRLDTDILVCFDEGARRAAEHGHDTRRELLLYVIHGVLHCLGHDDHDDESYERMHRAEDEILSALGVGATFHTATTPPATGAPADEAAS